MGLNIKNPDVERLAAEVADLAGETKTEAIRRALELRKSQLGLRGVAQSRGQRLRTFLERRVWPTLPANVVGKRLSKRAEDRILGYGPKGV
jgi:antitoxin VapB